MLPGEGSGVHAAMDHGGLRSSSTTAEASYLRHLLRDDLDLRSMREKVFPMFGADTVLSSELRPSSRRSESLFGSVGRASVDVDPAWAAHRHRSHQGEGACRSLMRDRMDVTGERWGLPGAEAVLELRSLRASGDFEEYWEFHSQRELERNHLDKRATNELNHLRVAP